MPEKGNERGVDRLEEGYNEDKKKEFEAKTFSSEFIDEFGLPDKVEITASNSFVLDYGEIGRKVVAFEEFLESAKFEIKPAGQPRIENGYTSQNGISYPDKIMIKCEISGLNNVAGEFKVAVLEDAGHRAVLSKLLEQLPEELKENIIAKAKESIVPPEEIAERRMQQYKEHSDALRAKKLRDDIVKLQQPGEVHLYSRMKTYTYEIQQSYGDESWGSGSYAEGSSEHWFLRTGTTRIEEPYKKDRYVGGDEFGISSVYKDEPSSVVRDKILDEKREELKKIVGSWKELFETQAPKDTVLYPDLQDWEERYSRKIGDLFNSVINEWDKEERDELERLKREYSSRQKAKEDLKKIIGHLSTLLSRARRYKIKIDGQSEVSIPRGDSIEEFSYDELQDVKGKLENYAERVDSQIKRQVKERHEIDMSSTTEVEKRELVESAGTPATWYLYGVKAGDLEKFGPKNGIGFGDKIAGQDRYIPGKNPVVGFHFDRTPARRYKTEINTRGLRAIKYEFPSVVSNSYAVDLLGIVENPDWQISWVTSDDNRKRDSVYGLANRRGLATLSGNNFSFNGWEGVGSGGVISEDDLYNLFGLEKRDTTQNDVRGYSNTAKGGTNRTLDTQNQELTHYDDSGSSGLGNSLAEQLKAAMSGGEGKKKSEKKEKPAEPAPTPKVEAKPVEKEEMTEEVKAQLVLDIELLESMVDSMKPYAQRPDSGGGGSKQSRGGTVEQRGRPPKKAPKAKKKKKLSERDKSMQIVYGKYSVFRSDLAQVREQLDSPTADPASLRGKLGTVRSGIESTFGRQISGKVTDDLIEGWIDTYSARWEEVLQAIEDNPDAQEYITEELTNPEELREKMRERLLAASQRGDEIDVSTVLEEILGEF